MLIVKNWKNRLQGKTSMTELAKELETPEVLKQKRDQLCFKCGQHQFTKAIIEAELLQWNQEMLRINNELLKMEQASEKAAHANLKEVPPLEAASVPLDPETPKIA